MPEANYTLAKTAFRTNSGKEIVYRLLFKIRIQKKEGSNSLTEFTEVKVRIKKVVREEYIELKCMTHSF